MGRGIRDDSVINQEAAAGNRVQVFITTAEYKIVVTILIDVT